MKIKPVLAGSSPTDSVELSLEMRTTCPLALQVRELIHVCNCATCTHASLHHKVQSSKLMHIIMPETWHSTKIRSRYTNIMRIATKSAVHVQTSVLSFARASMTSSGLWMGVCIVFKFLLIQSRRYSDQPRGHGACVWDMHFPVQVQSSPVQSTVHILQVPIDNCASLDLLKC